MKSSYWLKTTGILFTVFLQAASQAPVKAADANVLTIGIPGDIETLDPSLSHYDMANTIVKNVYDQPVRYARKSTPDGYMVADVTKMEGSVWQEFELQPDGVTYKIKVRPGMKFHGTGTEVTADTIRYKFQRAFALNGGDLWDVNTAGVFGLDQITVDGKYDLTIKLKAPNPLFLALMRDQDMGIIDPEAIKAHATADDPWATAWAAKNSASSGEFYVESWTPGVEMVLAANPDYWAGKACFDKVVLKIIPDSTNRALLLSQGAIDIAMNMSVDEAESLRGTKGVQVLSIPSRNQLMMGMNNSVAPFNDVKVRQALSYAVPYEQIVKNVFQGQANVAQGSFTHLDQYFDPSYWPYKYDPEKAKALLAEAGASNLSFTVTIQTGEAQMEEVAVVLQSAFRDIGVDMQIEKLAAGPYAEALNSRTRQAYIRTILSYVNDPFYTLFLWYKTGTLINWPAYSNPRIDQIADVLATELDGDKRTQLAGEAQKILNTDAPALYLGELNALAVMRDDITGFVQEPDHLLSFYEMCRKK